MKYLIAHFSVFLCTCILAKAQLSDDFSDGNYNSNPGWDGDKSKYEINADLQLQLNAPAESSHAYLSTSSVAVADAEWQFYVEISENPSSSNFCRIYLVSDQPDLSGSLNGYFVEIGGSQDEVSLYRQDGLSDSKLIDGTDDRVNTKPVQLYIKVNRDLSGNWTLSSKTLSEVDFITEGTVYDDTYITSQYFGIFCNYTSTRSSAFIFDNIQVSGTSVPDTAPPVITGLSVRDETSIHLTFNERLNEVKVTDVQHYKLENQHPSEVNYLGDTIKLTFADPMPNGIYQDLQISGLSDLNDNYIADTTINVLYFEPVVPAWQSVIINEFLPDPTPSQGTLPDDSNAEFIELYNQDKHPHNLENWTINGEALPNFILLPGKYVILCPADFSQAFHVFGDLINPESWPGLTNSGTTINLASPDNYLIDTYTYTSHEVGAGISTERMYHRAPCGISSNYKLSVHPRGATPAAQNSVFSDMQDTQAPNLLSMTAISYDSLILTFDEKVFNSSTWEEQVEINGSLAPDVVSYYSSDSSTLLLYFATPLPANMMHEVRLTDVQDCEGNVAVNLQSSLYLDLDPPSFEEVIILDTATIEIHFSEPLEASSAERESNYQLLPFEAKPSKSVLVGDSSAVRLYFKVGLQQADNLILETSSLLDRHENLILPESPINTTFLYQNEVDSLKIINAYQLDVYFKRPPNATSLLKASFEIDRSVGYAAKVLADRENPHKVRLFFNRSFVANRVHELTIQNLFDEKAERIITPVNRFYYDTEGPEIEELIAFSATEIQLTMSEAFQIISDSSPVFYLNGEVIPSQTYLLEGRHIKLQLSVPLAQEQNYRIGVAGLVDEDNNPSDPEQDYRFHFDQQAPQLDSAYFYSPNQIMMVFHEPLFKPEVHQTEIIQLLEPDEATYTVDYLQINLNKIILSITSQKVVQNVVFQLDKVYDLNHNMIPESLKVSLDNSESKAGHLQAISDHLLEVQLTLPTPGISTEDFILGGQFRPDSLAYVTEDRLLLFFAEAFLEDIRYTLQFKNQSLDFVYQDYIQSVEQAGRSTVHVQWETDLDPKTSGNPEHYLLNGSTHPMDVNYIDEDRMLQLIFEKTPESGALHEIRLSSLLDVDHMRIPDSRQYFGITLPAGLHDVIITEVMADPVPAQGLPKVEFVEIFNNTHRPIQLEGISFQDQNQNSKLPPYWLQPASYLILCDEDDFPEMAHLGTCLPLSSFPNLNGESDQLALLAADGHTTLHQISYDQSWYNDEHKRNGGWSLEMVDIDFPCREKANWTASTHLSGGTPGRPNAVAAGNPDTEPPLLLQVVAIEAEKVRLDFNEKLQQDAHAEIQFMHNDIAWTEMELHSSHESLYFTLTSPLEPGIAYTLKVLNVTDCSGNISTKPQRFTFFLPEPHFKNDILVSEILFHPRPGGVDFVELYNHSNRHINLKDWKIALEKADEVNTYSISTDALVMAPGSYLSISGDTTTLLADYPAASSKGQNHQAISFPNLLAEGGNLLLLDDQDVIMQEISFSPDWHHPLITETRGVSLERTTWKGTENDHHTWQSAASTVGFATPGYRNSQWIEQHTMLHQLKVSPSVIFPDQSGYQDYAQIRVHSEKPGSMLNLTIFDSRGRIIRRVVQNYSLASENTFTWDGTDQAQKRADDGYYIVWAETFDTDGGVQVQKTKLVVGSRY